MVQNLKFREGKPVYVWTIYTDDTRRKKLYFSRVWADEPGCCPKNGFIWRKSTIFFFCIGRWLYIWIGL